MDRRESRGQRNARITLAAAVLLACAGFGRSTYADQGADGKDHDGGILSVCSHGCKVHNIQRAVDKAQSGDTINIGPGTYFENVVIDGKDLTLAGASADQTTIDRGSQGSVISLSKTTVTLTDMTITHGSGENAGGVFMHDYSAHVEMTDVIVVSNVAAQSGGGIYIERDRFKQPGA